MRIEVEFFPQKREVSIELGDRSTGLDLVKALNLAPDVHILVKDGAPIPIDETLQDGNRIRVIAVVSGG